jgi:tyrosine ammonia-lyase
MGEGHFITAGGQTIPAQPALAQHGIAPYRFGHRDALALVNGTSCMTALAALNAADAERALAWSVALSAAHGELLHGRTEAWDLRLANLRGHPGQQRVTRRLLALVADSAGFEKGMTADVRLPDAVAGMELPTTPQDPYTIRCVPQVLGAVCDVLAEHRRVVEIELAAVTDNPVLVDESPYALHGGNFFGQHVGFASDSLAAAVIQQAVLAERQIARVVDIRQNGGLFPAFLQPDRIGLQSGFMGAQVTASALVAELRTQALPASIQSIPTNGNNQDIVSMGTISARKTRGVILDVFRVLAIQCLCVAQAADLSMRRGHPVNGNLAKIRSFARSLSDFLASDRPLSFDIDRIASEMRTNDGVVEIVI